MGYTLSSRFLAVFLIYDSLNFKQIISKNESIKVRKSNSYKSTCLSLTNLKHLISDPSCMLIESLIPPECSIETKECQFFASCPLDFVESQFVPTIELCSVAENVCSDGTRETLCPTGELFDNSTGKCILGTRSCQFLSTSFEINRLVV